MNLKCSLQSDDMKQSFWKNVEDAMVSVEKKKTGEMKYV